MLYCRASLPASELCTAVCQQQRFLAACLLLPLVLIGCGRASRDVGTVQSFLEGTITLSAELDSTGDFGGFEVLIASLADDDLDTLGIASTDSTGRFVMDIVAPNDGIYPLYIRRGGGLLKQDQIVVADGDSATTSIRLPLGNRPVMIRSNQNAAWMAYRNVKARHNTVLYEAMRTGTLDEATMGSGIRQTAEIMWSLRSTYPGTMGAQIAAHLANAGLPVLLLDIDKTTAANGLRRARKLSPDPFFANGSASSSPLASHATTT